MSEWQPIETAPEDGSEIDMWVISDDEGWREPDVWFNRHLGKFVYKLRRQGGPLLYMEVKGATHWRAQPKPPKT